MNERLSVCSSLLEVFPHVAPCLPGHIAIIAALASVAFGIVHFSSVNPHSRNWKRWNPVNMLFFCLCLCVGYCCVVTVVFIVCAATRTVFSKRTGWEHVTVLLFYCSSCLRFSCLSFLLFLPPPALLLAPSSVCWTPAALVRLASKAHHCYTPCTHFFFFLRTPSILLSCSWKNKWGMLKEIL